MPYQVLGVRFFDRKEVKDALSFIRAALNPESFSDIRRIINVPPRGIGKITLLKMFAGKEDGLSPALAKKIADFRDLLARIREAVLSQKPSAAIAYIMKETGLEKELKDGDSDDEERLLNIKELVTLALRYDELPDGEGMEKLLEDAALASDQDTLMRNENAVKLMTVHAAKGLEFDSVFITGLEQGLFPHERTGADALEESEEERRLFYVALTRARERVCLSYAALRTIFGARQVTIPSEFIMDIDPGLLEEVVFERERRGKVIYLD